MEQEWLVALLQQYGYPVLFLALSLSLVGLPVPDELVAVTAGVTTAVGLLEPVPALLVAALGAVAGRSVSYGLGWFLGAPLLDRFARRERWREAVERARAILERYGAGALSMAPFLPVLRHVVPAVAGASRVAFRRFALASYPAALAWSLLYFLLGRYAAGLWSLVPGLSGYIAAALTVGSWLLVGVVSRKLN